MNTAQFDKLRNCYFIKKNFIQINSNFFTLKNLLKYPVQKSEIICHFERDNYQTSKHQTYFEYTIYLQSNIIRIKLMKNK